MLEPNPNDRILDNTIEVVIGVLDDSFVSPGDGTGSDDSDVETPNHGDNDMAVPSEIHEQNLARLAGAGAQAHEHFVQFGKILDLSYEQDRKMVSLVESLGVREVTSRSGQVGVPGSVVGGQ